jgi:hypothetical protein
VHAQPLPLTPPTHTAPPAQDDYTESGAILGRGAFSFVLAVQRRSSGKPFAAKCVHSQGMAVTERREALRSALAEAVTLAKLRHPVRARSTRLNHAYLAAGHRLFARSADARPVRVGRAL